MTDVELPSTVPSSQTTGWPRRAALVAGAVVTVLSCVLGGSLRPAGADSLASAKAQAAQITSQLALDQQRLDTTAQQYDAAQQQLQQVGQQISQINRPSNQYEVIMELLPRFQRDASGTLPQFDDTTLQAAGSLSWEVVRHLYVIGRASWAKRDTTLSGTLAALTLRNYQRNTASLGLQWLW